MYPPRLLFRFVLAAAIMLPLVLSSQVWAASKESMHIKFSTWHPPASREVKTVWQPMLEELKDKTDGSIDYTLYSGGALGKGPEHFDIVKNGLSDMGYFTATWTPGRFPLTDVLSFATWINGKDIAVEIGNEMYDRILHQEFDNVKMIELNGCIQSFMWTTKEVNALEDVKGLKIRSPGGMQTRYIKSLGAEPVFMPLGDVYQALEKGTIDGVVTCPPLVLAFKLYEVLDHGTIATFGCVSEGVIMNQESWQETPDDLRPVVEKVCSNPFHTTGGLTQEVYKTMMQELKDNGVKMVQLSDKEAQRWASRFQEKTREWVAELENKGLPAKKTVRLYYDVLQDKGVNSPAIPDEWKKEWSE